MWNINNEKEKEYFKELMEVINNEKEIVYPPKEQIFNAFDLCDYKNLKVVIIGQDPYHNENQAHGLAFSVMPPTKLPPSLKNIYKEIENEFNIVMPKDKGDLSNWAKQGVLLLNTSLTVIKNKPASHSKIGWMNFTKNILNKISNEKSGIIFLLWGNHAQSLEELIDEKKHIIFKSPHPSPFSARKGFFGNNHFILTNNELKKQGKKEIDWLIK